MFLEDETSRGMGPVSTPEEQGLENILYRIWEEYGRAVQCAKGSSEGVVVKIVFQKS